MNENIERLMLKAGYAAPNMAGRGRLLVKLVIEECDRISKEAEHTRRDDYLGDDVPPGVIRWVIKEHFKETE